MTVLDDDRIDALRECDDVYLFGAKGIAVEVARKLLSRGVRIQAALVSERDSYNPSYVITANVDSRHPGIPVKSYMEFEPWDGGRGILYAVLAKRTFRIYAHI